MTIVSEASSSSPSPASTSETESAPSSTAPSADAPSPPYTLAIDIGGTGIKSLLLDGAGQPSGKRQRRETPHPATPQAVLDVIRSLLPDTAFDRVSVGFPGVVKKGVIHSAPNLSPSFAGFDLQAALTEITAKPVRVLNDAGLQGLGVIAGNGTEVVITLGTGMGFALYVDGHYVPNIELAHHPFRKSRTYEESVGNRARKRAGNGRWEKQVRKVLRQIQTTFNPDKIYVGGGNATKLSNDLPEGVVKIDNLAGLLGGIALWR